MSRWRLFVAAWSVLLIVTAIAEVVIIRMGNANANRNSIPQPTLGQLTSLTIYREPVLALVPAPFLGQSRMPRSPVQDLEAIAQDPNGQLVAYNDYGPGLFVAQPSGRTSLLPSDSARPDFDEGQQFASATIAADEYVGLSDFGNLTAIDLKSRKIVASISLPGIEISTVPAVGTERHASSIVNLGGQWKIQYGAQWADVYGLTSSKMSIALISAPVPHSEAAVQTKYGVIVVSPGLLTTLGNDGTSHAVHWNLPAEFAQETIVSATSDNKGGVIVGLSNAAGRFDARSSAILRIDSHGAITVLLRGNVPVSFSPFPNCYFATTPTAHATLFEPGALTVWQNRLIVNDTGCGSLLEMAAP